jgi:hypothetical protein
MQMQSYVIPRPPVRRALAMSAAIHALVAILAWWRLDSDARKPRYLDIELAPAVPAVEALPEEQIRASAPRERDTDEQVPAATTPSGEGWIVDAGIDAAPVDAARPDAAPPDAAPDAAPLIATLDGGTGDGDGGAEAVATGGDAGTALEPGTGSGSGDVVADSSEAPAEAGRGRESSSNASGEGSGSGIGSGSAEGAGTGLTNDPAVDGAATSPGTAANLLSYFPDGHVVTVLVRFDRLRGTEWTTQIERVLRPLPDYGAMFGDKDARLADKLETIVISSPEPNDPRLTTVIGRTKLGRSALRELLGRAAPVKWTTTTGGLFGQRPPPFPNDTRVFLSPFRGWFVLAPQRDLKGMFRRAPGDPDTIEAVPPVPPWLARIRAIEGETGVDSTGPAMVITMDLGGGRRELGPVNFGLGTSVPLPERLSLAVELDKQGVIVRGNIRFESEAAAIEFQQVAENAQRQVGGSWMFQRLVGPAAARVIQRLQLARGGQRLSYSTSISIADMRTLITLASSHLELRFKRVPSP